MTHEFIRDLSTNIVTTLPILKAALPANINASGGPVSNDLGFASKTEFVFKSVTHSDILNYANTFRGGSAPLVTVSPSPFKEISTFL